MDMVLDMFLTPMRLEVRASKQEGRAGRRTEAQAQVSQRHMGQGDPGITSQDTLKALVWFWIIDETLSTNLYAKCV